MKRILTVLATVMISSVVKADEQMVGDINWTYEVYNGKAEVCSAEPAEGKITIPSKLGGFPVTSIGEYAFYRCDELTAVTISSSVTSIGAEAFAYCMGLTSVTIPASVANIDELAFEYCSGLTSVTLPMGMTNIGDAFAYCAGLKSVTIPSSVTSIGEMAFVGCSGLGSITIPSSVKSIGLSAFSGCTGLTSVTIPSGVTYIGGAFSECTGLKSVTIPSSVTCVEDGTFGGCEMLASLTAPGLQDLAMKMCLQGGNVTSLRVSEGTTRICERAFAGMDSITTVTIPTSVTSIGTEAFAYCSGLTSVTVPTNVTNIDELAFANCSGLTSVTIPSSVISLGYGAFANCSGLTSVKLSSGLTSIGGFENCSGLTSVTIPSSVTNIAFWAFFGCDGLTDITIPARVASIEEFAFYNCSGLTSVRIPSSVMDIGGSAFGNCDRLTTVYVAEGDEDRVRGLLEDSGFDTAQVEFVASAVVSGFEVIVGAKVDIDVGWIGYAAKNLPKGLSYNSKTGKVTGSTKVKTGEYEVTFTKKGEADEVASFVVRAEKTPTVECEALEGGNFTVGVAAAKDGIPIQISAESGVKSVTAKNLPTGMKLVQDKTTKEWRITGGATKAGVFVVTLTVTTVAGNKIVEDFSITVTALPITVVGTYNGFVTWSNLDNPDGKTFGTIQVTTTDAGKIAAKLTTAAKSYSFSATNWDEAECDEYRVVMSLKSGETLELRLSSTARWDEHQLQGNFCFKAMPTDGTGYSISAQKNAFGKTWYFNAIENENDSWSLVYAENSKAATLTLTLNADGKTAIAGTLRTTNTAGKFETLKVSASGYADVSGMRNGCIIADFAPAVTISKVKKLLPIHTNLWFDRSNDHDFIGSAEIVSW